LLANPLSFWHYAPVELPFDLAELLNRRQISEVRKMTQPMTEAELLALPPAVDLATAGRAFGIGRTKAFELARADEFPVKVLKVGQKFRVPRTAILEALDVRPPVSAQDPASAA
jgi:hypothetical protein